MTYRTMVKRLEPYRPAAELFEYFKEEEAAVFLDSSLQGDLGRYSVIGRKPYLSLVQSDRLYINGVAAEGRIGEFLKRYLEENREENPTGLPLIAGAIGYFSYDYGRRTAGVPSRFEDQPDLIPEAVWNFYDNLIIEDHEKQEVFLAAGGRLQPAEEEIRHLEALLSAGLPDGERQPVALPGAGAGPGAGARSGGRQAETDGGRAGGETPRIIPDCTKEAYLKSVERMKDYITEGDSYIANLTRQLKIECGKDPYSVFRKLREINPSPFGGYFQYGAFQIVCASPERFLQMDCQRKIRTRPIKGTRKRGSTEAEDRALRRELEESEKDRSELLMIVDLERNDLSRVCEAHTVKVPELFTIEAYASVFHLVAEITGTLKEGEDVMSLMEAAFPGGSITGAPKRRAMEIIDELEQGKRGLYTGSVGYLSLDGRCDFNIVIRTLVHTGGCYHLGVGGGITCESESEFEYEETLQKAKALIEALRLA